MFIFGHGSGINRGCEAIIRTLTDLIASEFNTENIVCAVNAGYDRRIYYPHVDRFIEYPRFEPKTLKWVLNKIDERYISGGKSTLSLCNREIISEIKKSDICISVGGDNYCYGDPYRYYAVDFYVKKFGKPLIMYGASIEPDMMHGKKKKDLLRFDLIVTRESITYESLKNFMPDNKVCLYPDPAFMLKASPPELPLEWEDNNVVGLNISPLIMKYEREHGIVLNSVFTLVDRIIKKGRQVALIPHVTQAGNNDFSVLKKVYDKFKSTERVFLIDDNLTAEQYKGYIGKCRIFIGARTHSTIAAYSTTVPTLVIGYSVKSKGIDADIYDKKYNLLLPVQELDNPDVLIEKYELMEEKQKEIKCHLVNKMKTYVPRAYEGVLELKKWLQ